MKSKRKYLGSIKFVLFIFFATFLLLPLCQLILNINWNTAPEILRSSAFIEVIRQSIFISTIATLLSIIFGYVIAFVINRTQIKGKNIIFLISILPMLIPSIATGMGLVNIFGENGLFTRITHINIQISGMKGILVGSIIYSLPIAVIMISDAMKYANAEIYEAAETLGIPKGAQFYVVTLQYMKRPLIACAFAVFTMIVTDYGIPLSIGGRVETLSLYLYREVIGLCNFSSGAFIGIILLVPAVIAFLVDWIKNEGDNNRQIVKKIRIKKNIGRDVIIGAISYGISIFILAIFSSFVLISFFKNYPYNLEFTFAHIVTVLKKGGLRYLYNSVVISTLVAVGGTILNFMVAYITARTEKNITSKILHLLSYFTIAIPGIVLGLSYVIHFSGSSIYGTIYILVLVNIIHFFSSPYLMIYNALSKLSYEFESIAEVLNIPRVRLIMDVILPNSIGTLFEMFSFLFVNSMITISAVVFLYSTMTKPLSLLINEFENSMAIEAAACVSLLILIVNVMIKVVIGLTKKVYYSKC